MPQIPQPIFKDKLNKINWEKIYAREYGVQYSEMAILCLSNKAKPHIPKPTLESVIVPEGKNSAFYINEPSWIELVEGLNQKYTSNLTELQKYEKKFVDDGEAYLALSKKTAKTRLTHISNQSLQKLYLDYREKLFNYSLFAWSAFILNNYIADKASSILDQYLKKWSGEDIKQEVYDSLFHPQKRAAVLELQYKVNKLGNKLTNEEIEKLYVQFKWLSCLDIHNTAWSIKEFRQHITSMVKTSSKNLISFTLWARKLKIKSDDLHYLMMAKRFVYIKDARDDYRRQGVYYASNLFKELARRMRLDFEDISYLTTAEILDFLSIGSKISKQLITKRKNGFILYLDIHKKIVCLQRDAIPDALKAFRLNSAHEALKELIGTVASKGIARGKVAIVHGFKDLKKVKLGDILVAVSTHPDYVPAMRRAAAIVTDEGGITSHAAIVSREFGIPCIVGTKQATKVLKDDEKVEVNANQGWVKRL